MTNIGQGGGKQRENAIDLLEWQRVGCSMPASPSPFYERLFAACIEDIRSGNRAIEARLESTPMAYDAAVGLRLFAGVQRCWFEGLIPALDDCWPQPDVTGDAAKAYAVMRELFENPPALLLDWLTRDPQTNEVGRAAGLAAGLAEIVRLTRKPVRLLEIGSSGGLNLRLDHFAFENALGNVWGDPSSALRFGADAYEGSPPFGSGIQIAQRKGCDLNPIDASHDAGALQLLSYVWPDQPARQTRLRNALAVAREHPVAIDQAHAADWVEEHLVPEPGFVTVLMHSIMWQYLPEAEQTSIRKVLFDRGAGTGESAPIAWLTLEPPPEIAEHANVTVTVWPTGQSKVVAHSGYHGPPVKWLG